MNEEKKNPSQQPSLFFLGIILFNTLSGCTQWYWVSDTQSISELNSAILECNEYSYKLFPPHVVQSVETNHAAIINNAMLEARRAEYERQRMHYEDSLNNRSWKAQTNHTNFGNYYNSTTTITPNNQVTAPIRPTGTYLPEADVVSVDINQDGRNAALKKCMYSKGFRLEER